MLRKLLLLLALGLGFLVVKAPASLVDGLLAHFTAEGLRLQRAEGTLWQGRGILASRDASGRSLSPWLPAVSYTHLDVYKRQHENRSGF